MKKYILITMLLLSMLPFGACSRGAHSSSENNSSPENQASNNTESNDKSDSNESGSINASSENDSSSKDKESSNEAENTEADETKTEEPKAEVGSFKGNYAIDFELESFQDGNKYKLSDYLGKDPIIIKFFASWCGPCKMEMPELNEIYKEYKDQGLKVFAVNLGNGDSPEDVQKLIDDYILEYPVLKDERSMIAAQYAVRGIPVNVFIGKDGIIVKHNVGMLSKEKYEEYVKVIMDISEE